MHLVHLVCRFGGERSASTPHEQKKLWLAEQLRCMRSCTPLSHRSSTLVRWMRLAYRGWCCRVVHLRSQNSADRLVQSVTRSNRRIFSGIQPHGDALEEKGHHPCSWAGSAGRALDPLSMSIHRSGCAPEKGSLSPPATSSSILSGKPESTRW